MPCVSPVWWLVNIGSGNGLLLSGNKPLPEPVWPRSMSPYSVTWPQWVKNSCIYKNVIQSWLNYSILYGVTRPHPVNYCGISWIWSENVLNVCDICYGLTGIIEEDLPLCAVLTLFCHNYVVAIVLSSRSMSSEETTWREPACSFEWPTTSANSLHVSIQIQPFCGQLSFVSMKGWNIMNFLVKFAYFINERTGHSINIGLMTLDQ